MLRALGPGGLATGFGAHSWTMASPSWAAGELPLEPTGLPVADWARLVGDIPTLGRGVTLAMPCVWGLDVLSAAMADLRWPGPYEVK